MGISCSFKPRCSSIHSSCSSPFPQDKKAIRSKFPGILAVKDPWLRSDPWSSNFGMPQALLKQNKKANQLESRLWRSFRGQGEGLEVYLHG